MKIAIIFDAYEKGGGSYFQSINTTKLLNKFNSDNFEIKFITMLPNTDKELIENNIKPINFKKQRISRLFYILSQSKIINFFIRKLKLINPFSNFLKKQKFDLVIFLGPSFYINCCEEINFMVNLYDLNFRFDNYFPEYKNENIFNDTNAFVNKSVSRAYRILVDTNRTKNELVKYFNCSEDKIIVYPFSSHLPNLWSKIKDTFDSEKVLREINIKKDDKYIFYPAQFWAHKNHKYIVDAAINLKKKGKLNFKIIFAGSNKGNLNFIKSVIKENNLENNFLIYGYLTNEQIIALYLKTMALVMPSYVARSTLPLYEAFFFKIPIFYSKKILDNELEQLVFSFDLNDPSDLANKIENYTNSKNELIDKTEKAYSYFLKNCTDKKKEEILKNLLNSYKYISSRWKSN